eukprot:1127458-Pelagomonas_calceolata.AAC.3
MRHPLQHRWPACGRNMQMYRHACEAPYLAHGFIPQGALFVCSNKSLTAKAIVGMCVRLANPVHICLVLPQFCRKDVKDILACKYGTGRPYIYVRLPLSATLTARSFLHARWLLLESTVTNTFVCEASFASSLCV